MKVKYSALVSDMRNKLNGSVAARNRYGSYLRNKVTPVNRQTAPQQLQRQQFGALSTAWRSLAQEQREAWNNSAANYPRTDVFGDSKILSGQALYISLNRNLFNVGAPGIDVPSAPGAFPILTVTSFSAETMTGSINLETVPPNYRLLVFATPPVSPGREFVKNLYKLLNQASPLAVTTGGGFDVGDLYENVIGSLPSSETKVGIKLVLIHRITGEASAPATAWSINA